MTRALTKPLCVLLLSAACAGAQTVEGHVVNSATGSGIAGVAVTLAQAGKTAYSTTTDAQGRFRIEPVKDGAYMTRYEARGFFTIPGIMDGPSRQPFQVAAGAEPVRLEAKMQPIGKIAGRVLDASGKPVPNAPLWLHWENSRCKPPMCVGFAHQAKTDEKGEYSVANLEAPGAWLVSAAAPSSWPPPESREDQKLGWTQTFYPGVTDPSLAARIVTGSDLLLDIKLAAVPVHRIRGVVLDTHGSPIPKAALTLSKGIDSPVLHTDTKDDGAFEFDSVPVDDWRMFGKADLGGIKLWGAEPVDVNNHDVEGFELRLTAPFSIGGRVVMEGPQGVPAGAPAPRAPEVLLEFNSDGLRSADAPQGGTALPDANGDFTIRNLYPGPYQILVPGAEPPYYLESARVGDRDAFGSDVPILSGAQPVMIIYKLGGGAVSGTVEKCASGVVALVPQDPALRRPGITRFVSCDSSDRYVVQALRPGEYYALAMTGDGGASGLASIAGMFELDERELKQATSVTVRAGETTAVDLRPIGRSGR